MISLLATILEQPALGILFFYGWLMAACSPGMLHIFLKKSCPLIVRFVLAVMAAFFFGLMFAGYRVPVREDACSSGRYARNRCAQNVMLFRDLQPSSETRARVALEITGVVTGLCILAFAFRKWGLGGDTERLKHLHDDQLKGSMVTIGFLGAAWITFEALFRGTMINPYGMFMMSFLAMATAMAAIFYDIDVMDEEKPRWLKVFEKARAVTKNNKGNT